MVLGALLACAASVAAAASEYRLVAYVAGWEKIAPIPVEKLTAINFAFGHVANGRVVLDHAGDDATLHTLGKLRARNPQLKILLSVGGWGADGFSDAALTSPSRERFADSAAALVAEHDLDGIDIDWEYPGLPGPGIVHRDADEKNFTLLLAALRQRLDRLARERHRSGDAGYAVTAALADSQFVAHVQLRRVAGQLDWINLMTYDFHNSLTPTTGHHSALRRSKTSAPSERCVECAVRQYLDAGVPARKLVVGVPFYGRAFADVTAHDDGLDQRYGRYQGDNPWPQLVADFIDRNGYERHWDDTAKEPYLWNATTRTFVSYDDPQSLALKAQFVKARGLGGKMYWEQSQDPNGELLEVLVRGLR
jgi:chitinase